MEIRATVHQRYAVFDSPRVNGRLEIKWTEDGPWLNLGLITMDEDMWLVFLLLLSIGARKANVPMRFSDMDDFSLEEFEIPVMGGA